jgi:toxin ParE1/3/4
MRVPSHPDADIELEEAAFYYEKRSEGLGDDFIEEFERTIERIVSSPTRYRKVHGNIRQLRLSRFPFNVVYEIYENDIYILAVAHVRRRPFYWIQRHT